MSRISAVVVLMFAVAVCAAQVSGRNLISNPSLEGNDLVDGLPRGWFSVAGPRGSYQFKVDNTGHTGAKSLLMEGTGDYAVTLTGMVDLEPGKRYAARAHILVEGAKAGAVVKFDYFDENGAYISSTQLEDFRAGFKDWRQMSLTDRAAAAPKARRIATSLALHGDGKAWFDDVEMIVFSSPPGGNLLENGSFEDVAGEKPMGLVVGNQQGGKVAIRAGSPAPEQGWHSLRLLGEAEWATALLPPIKIDRAKTYTLTGLARAQSGGAVIKLDYFKQTEYLGQTSAPPVTADKWQPRSVTSELDKFPAATHIAAVAVGHGKMDVRFDGFVLQAK